jgi:hypothetical protein
MDPPVYYNEWLKQGLLLLEQVNCEAGDFILEIDCR